MAVLGVVGFAVSRGSADQKENLLELGQRYLDELDYEQAVVCFEEYLEIDPKSVKAYLGLAEAYVATGDVEKALEVLEEGYVQTQSRQIADRQEKLEQAEVALNDNVMDWQNENLEAAIREETNTMISGGESSPSISSLSIIIKDYEVFTYGFHYEIPTDENSYIVVDFDRGISGHFSYLRELTEQELGTWRKNS